MSVTAFLEVNRINLANASYLVLKSWTYEHAMDFSA